MMVKHKTPLFLLSFLFIALASCKKGNVVPEGKDLVLTPQEQQKVTSDNVFTLKLYQYLSANNTGNGNILVSPLSASFALGMTSNGAAGNTLSAMRSTLHFNGYTEDFVNSYYNKLITELPKLDPNTTLSIANSIWYKQGFDVVPQFLQTNNTSYHAKVQTLDFTSSSAKDQINNWVNDQTKGKIPTIIDHIPAEAVMYLVNAIYFKSSWKEKFDAAQTAKQDFHLTDASTVQADFMNKAIDYNVYNNNDVIVAELPYSGSKYSMVIAMPVTGTVSQLVAGIDSAKWQSWMKGLGTANGPIIMPKFKFSYGISLKDALTTLGMGNAFVNGANFSRINATYPLVITDVNHKTYIEVNEDGTTATAATSVGVGTTAIEQRPPIVFNHPFLFVIREMKSGLILFMGTMNNPSPPAP